MSHKEQLYYLLENYKNKKYSAECFCEQFVKLYAEKSNDNEMTFKENDYMHQFCRLSERYSPYKEDLMSSSYFIDENKFQILFDDLYDKFVFDCHYKLKH